jgi:hypothetical protein
LNAPRNFSTDVGVLGLGIKNPDFWVLAVTHFTAWPVGALILQR